MSMKEQTKLLMIAAKIKGIVKSDNAHFVPSMNKPINTTANMLKEYIR